MDQGHIVCKWQNWLQSPCLSHFSRDFFIVQCPAGAWPQGSLHLCNSKSGWRTCSSPWKEVVLTWGSLEQGLVRACWRCWQGWLEALLTFSLWNRAGLQGAGTEVSGHSAWFIKSHHEHCPGTTVIYPHFFLVNVTDCFTPRAVYPEWDVQAFSSPLLFAMSAFFSFASEVIYGLEKGSHFGVCVCQKRADGFKVKPSIIGQNIWLKR